MIKLYPGWEEALLTAHSAKLEKGVYYSWHRIDALVLRRSVKARIKELTRMILRGEAEVIDPPTEAADAKN